jgi:hypothetical protein
VAAVPSAATAGQLSENAAAADLELTDDDCRNLVELQPVARRPPGMGVPDVKEWVYFSHGSALL